MAKEARRLDPFGGKMSNRGLDDELKGGYVPQRCTDSWGATERHLDPFQPLDNVRFPLCWIPERGGWAHEQITKILLAEARVFGLCVQKNYYRTSGIEEDL